MGVGKSTVGRRLARTLGLPFVDSDTAIEEAAGLSAAELFERWGEEAYRYGERQLVARLVEGEIRVIATGGGAFIDPSTRDLLNNRTITIWLDAPIDLLVSRVTQADTRPLLRNSNPKATLERLAKERKPSYSSAHIHVKCGDDPASDVVELILRELERHCSMPR